MVKLNLLQAYTEVTRAWTPSTPASKTTSPDITIEAGVPWKGLSDETHLLDQTPRIRSSWQRYAKVHSRSFSVANCGDVDMASGLGGTHMTPT
jgi:hypothetical protein